MRGNKERGLEIDTEQENNKLNGNKVNETGYKPDLKNHYRDPLETGKHWIGLTNNAETEKTDQG